MYVKMMIILLLWETIDSTYTTTLKGNKLIQNICQSLHDKSNLKVDEDQQWELLCDELFHSNDGNQYTTEKHNPTDEEDITQNKLMRKAVGRVSSIRIASGIRTSRISSGIRTSSSLSRYRSTRTGATFSRPNGWQWSRSALIFLPLATRFGHRSRSSSNRFTTTSSVTYYYCTSDIDPSVEIQCTSTNGDSQCCEDETTQQPFCCGGDIPDDLVRDANRATQTIARIFYTLTALALCMHLFMRRFCR